MVEHRQEAFNAGDEQLDLDPSSGVSAVTTFTV